MFFHIYFRLRRPSVIYTLPLTSRNVVTSPILFSDPENVGIAVGISLLSCIEAEILRFLTYFRLMAAILLFARDTLIIPTSLTFSWVALPFGENRMKKIQPAPKIEGGFPPPLSTLTLRF
jgi:hypothetical protein